MGVRWGLEEANGVRWRERERRWFVLERPRRDTNGGSETEVTVTSKLPSKYRKKQGDRKETEKRREGRILWGRYQRLGDDDVYIYMSIYKQG